PATLPVPRSPHKARGTSTAPPSASCAASTSLSEDHSAHIQSFVRFPESPRPSGRCGRLAAAGNVASQRRGALVLDRIGMRSEFIKRLIKMLETIAGIGVVGHGAFGRGAHFRPGVFAHALKPVDLHGSAKLWVVKNLPDFRLYV